ncbi:MAG: UDP-N-acetylmuramate--L-alanine ligase [Phycicoccus sp.]|nr:UDP-N-acetylmuramate--L-alanine ligase [Phycicoccus sp.]NMM34649.1 UDP-N-acetylmuramate--L-alanine ligase [Phycicoccus sp.]
MTLANGSNERFDFTTEVPSASSLGSVHFIAIGGAGMSGVARVMLAQGIAVSGSDAKESLVLSALSAEGAVVHVGHDASHVAGADTVVISSAIREGNVELREARSRGLRVMHRSQALASVMRGSRKVAVAGANGKTTTTSMLTVALQYCGLDPSFAIGGELAKHGTNAHRGTGDIFVVEADESDGSFLVYRPDVAIVTNVQPDHLDFYGTFEAVQTAYASFAATVHPRGLLVTCADDQGSRALAGVARAAGTRVITYGTASDADVRLTELGGVGLRAHAVLVGAGLDGAGLDAVVLGRLEIGMPGRHNLLNATAAFVAATAGLGQEPARVLEGLAGFTGTRRRFEPKGEVAGVRVVDDYAHNPGKVTALVETASGIAAPGRLVVVFQPHLYSRTRDFAAELAAALSPAEVVIVMDVYAAREDPLPGVTGALITDRLLDAVQPNPDEGGRFVRFVPSWSDVAPLVAQLVVPGDLVVTVGAGDVTMIGPEILRLLTQRLDPTAVTAGTE